MHTKSIELIGLYVLHLRDTPIEIESKIKCCCVLSCCALFSLDFIFYFDFCVWLSLCVCVTSILVDRLDTMQTKQQQQQAATDFKLCGTWITVFTYTSPFRAGTHQI